MTPGKLKIVLLAGGLVAGLLLAELALQLYSLLTPRRSNILVRMQAPYALPDARLGERPNPDYPDHDENGFRNESVPRRAEVVAMGDSQTYGTHVLRAEAWPSQLQAMSGRSVYSIACGGWGPTHSLVLLDRALAFRPRVLLEAFYPGNDLYDCFAMVYYQNHPELRTSDAALAAEIRNAESRERLKDHYAKLYDRVLGGGATQIAQRLRDGSSPGFKAFLRRHSKLYQLARILRNAATPKAQKSGWEEEKRDAQQGDGREALRVLESGGWRTIFTPTFRSEGMNLEDPRLAEGFRLCLEALERMGSRVRASGADFVVVLIPTKEIVFRDVVPVPLESDPAYRQAIVDEQRIRERTIAFMKERGIAFADPLPALRESLARGVQPYPESLDGHPNARGHQVIAWFLLEEIERRGLGRSGAPRRGP